MKIWEADKGKRYVDQDNLVWFYDNVDWKFKRKEDCDEMASPLSGMNWYTIELQDLTPIKKEKTKKKLYAYADSQDPRVILKRYIYTTIDQRFVRFDDDGCRWFREPQYDLEFE